MTPNERSREAAYADLVSGLIDARIDVASERFDAELEAAEAAGRLDPATARLLRWWQRESVRSVTEHARTTVPATLVALEKADREAREAVHRAEAAWTTARGVSARAAFSAQTPVAAPPAEVTPPASEAPEPSEQRAPTAQPSTPQSSSPQPAASAPAPVAPAPSSPTPPAAAPVTSAPATPAPPAPAQEPAWSTLEPPNYPGGPLDPATRNDPTAGASASARQPAPAPTAPVPPPAGPATTPGEAPGIVDLTAHEEPAEAETSPAGRRRTLLAGLTVLPRTD